MTRLLSQTHVLSIDHIHICLMNLFVNRLLPSLMTINWLDYSWYCYKCVAEYFRQEHVPNNMKYVYYVIKAGVHFVGKCMEMLDYI